MNNNETVEVTVVNGTVTGVHLGAPMQDATPDKPEDNEKHYVERSQNTRAKNYEELLDDEPVKESGGSGSGLPEGAPYQQLVTDADGVAKWEDRLAYESEPQKTVVLSETTVVTAQNDSGYFEAPPVKVTGFLGSDEFEAFGPLGNTITVVFDGVPYDCPVMGFGVGNCGAGNAQLDGHSFEESRAVPFLVWDYYGDVYIYTETASTHTVEIYHLGESEIYPVSEKFIPTTVPVIQSATVGQTIVVKSVDENGKPTEWEAVDVSGGGGGGGDVFVAHWDNATDTCDCTFEDIIAALVAGKACFLQCFYKDYSGLMQMPVTNPVVWNNAEWATTDFVRFSACDITNTNPLQIAYYKVEFNKDGTIVNEGTWHDVQVVE